jgi:hypothetical protein
LALRASAVQSALVVVGLLPVVVERKTEMSKVLVAVLLTLYSVLPLPCGVSVTVAGGTKIAQTGDAAESQQRGSQLNHKPWTHFLPFCDRSRLR